jgi:hypothetical protein
VPVLARVPEAIEQEVDGAALLPSTAQDLRDRRFQAGVRDEAGVGKGSVTQ